MYLNKNKIKTVLFFLIVFGFFTTAALAATTNSGYQIITSIPGTDIGQGDPATGISLAEYIRQIYIFSLGIVGLVAVAAMVYWSFYYTASAGNPSKMSDAIGGIKDAALGLVLLLLASVVLGLINPKLTTLSPLDDLENIPGQGSWETGTPDWVQKCRIGAGCQVLSCSDVGKVEVTGCDISTEPAPRGENNLCCAPIINASG